MNFKEEFFALMKTEKYESIFFVATKPSLSSSKVSYVFTTDKKDFDILKTPDDIENQPINNPKLSLLIVPSKELVHNRRPKEYYQKRYDFYLKKSNIIESLYLWRTFFSTDKASWRMTRFFSSLIKNKNLIFLRYLLFIFNSFIKIILKPFVILTAFIFNLVIIPFSVFLKYYNSKSMITKLNYKKNNEYIFDMTKFESEMKSANEEHLKDRTVFYSTGFNLFTFVLSVAALIVSIVVK